MKPARAGFTLIELGLVLVILSLMISGILTIATQNIRQAKREELQTKMDAIETALMNYRKAWNRLPCPADTTLADSAANFGLVAANPGSCVGGSPAAISSGNAVGGMLPVRSIGLPDSYAYDPWGGRFLYAVDSRITGTNAFTTYNVTNTTIGAMTVYDGADTPVARTTKAIAVLVSFGPNGHGAYQYGGAQKDTGSTNAHELENCAGAATGCTFNTDFYMHANTVSTSSALDSFDDIVRYYTRAQFPSATEDLLTESP